MRQRRRQLLRTTAAAVSGLGLAGCNSSEGTDDASEPATTDGSTGGEREQSAADASVDAAVAAEWAAIRSRVDDAYALGAAGHPAAGAGVAGGTFERFEHAGGEYGAHEYLEETSDEHYGGFEGALTDLEAALDDGDLTAAAQARADTHDHLRAVQEAVVGADGANALDVLRFGAAVNDVELLVAAGDADGAATVAGELLSWWEDTPAHDALSAADGDAYGSLEGAIADAETAAAEDDLDGVREATDAALDAAAQGAYALAAPGVANAGRLAAYQAHGWDAAALSGLGGPGQAFAHAAVLNGYRVRVQDAGWLAAQGATDAAAATADAVFAHFEAADAHDALEEADHDAYEAFEEGLESLSTAAEDGDQGAVTEAVETVDESLLTGIEALTAGTGATVLEAGFFRARLRDADELARLGAGEEAVAVVEDLFGRFEADEAGFHEAFEETDHDAYEAFEGALESLISAYESGGDAADPRSTALSELLGYETAVGTTGHVSAAESSYLVGRAFDAAALAALDRRDRAATVAESALGHFEAGAGGFHEALEEADHDTYEAFEDELAGVGDAASAGDDVTDAGEAFFEEAVGAVYALVGTGGSFGEEAAAIVSDVFADFENSDRVHEALEEADHDTYETFESELDAFAGALEEGGATGQAAAGFAAATQRAQFAVVGAVDDAPVDGDGLGGEDHHQEDLAGGPNVVEGVPDDADHVVDMQAVAFEPAELTVSVGDTVAWPHRAGEPHSVTAYGDDIPEAADYWASGGFDSEDAAREGWENGKGAVQSGKSYVHTFETPGEHEYVCIPHERAGMVGTVVVEE